MASDTARQLVLDALKQNGASLFTPLVGADDVDVAVRGSDGQYIEVLVRTPGEGKPRAFNVARVRPKPHWFIACVTTENETWLLPSGVFERFSDAGKLDLDEDDGGEPLSERLIVYRDRWQLITDFKKYRSTLTDPVALRMRIAFG
jgi:hypothetical protein